MLAAWCLISFYLCRWLVNLADGRLAPFREAIEFPNPDFASLARACGAQGFTAKQPGDLKKAIADALACDGPAIVDCVVAADEIPNLPHVDAAMVGNYALAKIREAVMAVTG